MKTTLLERNLDLIRKIVWSYVKGNVGLEFDDLFSSACLACLEVSNRYDPSKGKESTFVYRVVHNAIRTIIGKDSIQSSKEYHPESIEIAYDKTPENQIIAEETWQETLQAMSPKAHFIYDLVIDYNEVYMPTDKPKICRGIIIDELRERGWKWNDIWETFSEIKNILAISSL